MWLKMVSKNDSYGVSVVTILFVFIFHNILLHVTLCGNTMRCSTILIKKAKICQISYKGINWLMTLTVTNLWPLVTSKNGTLLFLFLCFDECVFCCALKAILKINSYEKPYNILNQIGAFFNFVIPVAMLKNPIYIGEKKYTQITQMNKLNHLISNLKIKWSNSRC